MLLKKYLTRPKCSPRLKFKDLQSNHKIKGGINTGFSVSVGITKDENKKVKGAASGENEKKFQKFSTLDVKDEPELAVWSVSLVNDSSHPTLKGTANIALNGNFVIENMPIRENKEGEVFLAMPSYRNNSTGEFHDIVNPVSKEFREKLQQAVLEKYEKAKEMEVNLLDGGKEDEMDRSHWIL